MDTNNQPRNIFELINSNIVSISQDMNSMHEKIDRIYAALYPEKEQQNQPTENGNDSAYNNE